MLDLVYINTGCWEDLGLFVELHPQDPNLSYVFVEKLMLVQSNYVKKVDEAFRLLYDGYKGLGDGIETQLHHKYDNEGKNC